MRNTGSQKELQNSDKKFSKILFEDNQFSTQKRETIAREPVEELTADGTIQRCEKEKNYISKEIMKLKEEASELRVDPGLGKKWRESLEIFEKAETDLLTNLENSAELRSMRGEIQRDLTVLGQQASQLKRVILKGEEDISQFEQQTKKLNENYLEKQEVQRKIDYTLKENSSQRTLITGALRNVILALMGKLYEEKVNGG
jgi:hypothetical protein